MFECPPYPYYLVLINQEIATFYIHFMVYFTKLAMYKILSFGIGF